MQNSNSLFQTFLPGNIRFLNVTQDLLGSEGLDVEACLQSQAQSNQYPFYLIRVFDFMTYFI